MPFADSPAAVSTADLLAIRRRWQHTCQEPAILRIWLLASYPIEPLVPYLGVGLLDAGLRPAVRVGPPGQIIPQCLDLDDGEPARFRPDIVVVAPRFEEASKERVGGRPRRDPRRSLLGIADTAVAAGKRLGCLLVFVLPALPQTRDAAVAGALAVRDHLRARLAGVPGVCVVDAEDAVRHVGARRARSAARFRLGAARYTEELFACLAAQLVRTLRIRYGMTWRAVVIDADSLLLPAGAADLHATVQALRGPLRTLHRRGVRLALRAGPACDGLWDILAADFPDLVCDLVDGSIIDERPIDAQLRAIAANADVPADQTVLLTANPDLAAKTADGLGHPCAVLLTGEPAAWPAALREAGIFDRAPGDADPRPGAVTRPVRRW